MTNGVNAPFFASCNLFQNYDLFLFQVRFMMVSYLGHSTRVVHDIVEENLHFAPLVIRIREWHDGKFQNWRMCWHWSFTNLRRGRRIFQRRIKTTRQGNRPSHLCRPSRECYLDRRFQGYSFHWRFRRCPPRICALEAMRTLKSASIRFLAAVTISLLDSGLFHFCFLYLKVAEYP